MYKALSFPFCLLHWAPNKQEKHVSIMVDHWQMAQISGLQDAASVVFFQCSLSLSIDKWAAQSWCGPMTGGNCTAWRLLSMCCTGHLPCSGQHTPPCHQQQLCSCAASWHPLSYNSIEQEQRRDAGLQCLYTYCVSYCSNLALLDHVPLYRKLHCVWMCTAHTNQGPSNYLLTLNLRASRNKTTNDYPWEYKGLASIMHGKCNMHAYLTHAC